jgi:shikimate kinase
MKRVFITGMSGTGKSSVIEALHSRGFTAIDTDYGDWCEPSLVGDNLEMIWREERMYQLLRAPLTSSLFVSGCYSNQGKFYSYFDVKILFNAPIEVILERVAHRTTNSYGKSEKERDEIRSNFKHILPLLRESADFEVDAVLLSINQMADRVIEIASG